MFKLAPGRVANKLLRTISFAIVAFAGFSATRSPAELPPTFALHDNDTLVFYGDSITEQLGYCRDIESYVVSHYPSEHVHFITSGWGGDTVRGGNGGSINTRLRRDVFSYHPSVVTIFLGMNDGRYTVYDPPIFNRYVTGMLHIIGAIRLALPHARIVLVTPSNFDQKTKTWVRTPSYNNTLLRFGEYLKILGSHKSIQVIDVNAPMARALTEARKTDPRYTLTQDGVHPNNAGHAIIAATILAAWHAAPPDPIQLTLDKETTVYCPLPWPLPKDASIAKYYSTSFDTYAPLLVVAPGLKVGMYRLQMDGADLGMFDAKDLQDGIDLSSIPQCPLVLQADKVYAMVVARTNKWHHFSKGYRGGVAKKTDLPTAAEVHKLQSFDRAMYILDTDIRLAAAPTAHKFLLTPVQR